MRTQNTTDCVRVVLLCIMQCPEHSPHRACPVRLLKFCLQSPHYQSSIPIILQCLSNTVIIKKELFMKCTCAIVYLNETRLITFVLVQSNTNAGMICAMLPHKMTYVHIKQSGEINLRNKMLHGC